MDDEDRYTRITLRIPRDLHAILSEEAGKTSKSLNAEIIGRLQSSFAAVLADPKDALKTVQTGTLITELLDRFPVGLISIKIGKDATDEEDDD